MVDYRLVTGSDGAVEGVWLRDVTLAQDRMSLIFLLTKEGLPEDLRVTVAAGGYRVVANTYDNSGGCFVMWGAMPVPGEQAAVTQRPAEPVAATRPQPAPVSAPMPERVSEPPPQPPAPFRGGKTLLVGVAMVVIGFLLSLPCAFFGGIFVGALAAWLWIRWEKTAPEYTTMHGALAGFLAGIGSFGAVMIASLAIKSPSETDPNPVLTALALSFILGLFSAVATGTLTGFLIGRDAKSKWAEPVPGICFKCHKPLSEMFGGAFSGGLVVMSGSDMLAKMAQAPFSCKSCGTQFCVDCMAKIKEKNNNICPYCKQNSGW